MIAFYRGERNGETYPVQDDDTGWNVISNSGASIVTVLSAPGTGSDCFGRKRPLGAGPDAVPGLVEQVANDLDAILEKGSAKLYVRCANNTVTSEPGFDGFLISLY